VTYLRPLVVVVLLLALCGCERIDQALEALAGHYSQSVLLTKGPIQLGPQPIELTSPESLKVLGSDASVCVVLRGDVPLGPQPVVDRMFKESLKGAHLTVSITRTDGRTFELPATNQAWRLNGLVAPGELAACSSCGCSREACSAVFPKGAVIQRVRVASSVPLNGLGVYWSSTNAFDGIPQPASSSAPNAALQCKGPSVASLSDGSAPREPR
jgi:hypothetical protein